MEALVPADLATVGGMLLPYRQRLPATGEETAASDAWNTLVAHVSAATLARVFGEDWSADSTMPSSAEDHDGADDGLPPTAAETERSLRFTPVDLKRTWREGAVGQERTTQARDRSWALERVLQAAGGPQELLGEWEVAFVLCYYLGNYAAGEQWRRIVALCLTCREAVVARGGSGGGSDGSALLVQVLAALRRMLEVLAAGEEHGFLGEEVLAEVARLLRGFGKMLREEETDDPSRGVEVRREFEHLKEWMARKMDCVLDTREMLRKGTVMTEEGDIVEVEAEGLDEEEETGEYAPVIVEDVDLQPFTTAAAATSSRGSSPVDVMMVDEEEEDDPRF